MRITEWNVPDRGLGLGACRMRPLGDVVLLIGPNGSGKTRMLGLLEECARQEATAPGPDSVKEATASSGCVGIDISNPSVLRFVPRSLEMADAWATPLSALGTIQITFGGTGPEAWAAQALPYVQEVQNRWIEATHPNIPCADDAKAYYVERYSRLCAGVSELLGLALSREGGVIMFDGRSARELSEGQFVLLLLAAKLHALDVSLAGSLLILDEPETHLHPAALLTVFRKLRQAVGEQGQLWVATHSLHLFAEVSHDQVWYLKKGKATKSRGAEEIIRGLLGDEEDRCRLAEVLGLPWRLGLIRYATECLAAPKPADTGKEDPQVGQIWEFLNKCRPSRPLRLLDFGFGQARLLEGLVESCGDNFSSRFDYFGYDPTPDSVGRARIAAQYGSGAGREYRSLEELMKSRKGFFDVVILCNVLHEIPAAAWVEAWNALALLAGRDGKVLVLEDLHLPEGEKAHEHGFLLVDAAGLRVLAGASESGSDFVQFAAKDPRYEARLMACAFPASYGARVTGDTLCAALSGVRERTLARLRAVRDRVGNQTAGDKQADRQIPADKDGRLHAMHVFSFTHVSMALQDLQDAQTGGSVG